MPFDFSQLKKKKKPPMQSVSGGLRSASKRPSMSKGVSTKAADALANMGFGKGMKVKGGL
jgi:hypothetical protein